MPGAMAAVARPGILARVGHHRGPHWVGLDVPQNDVQVVAVLDDRGSEAALPDVAAGSLSPVVPPGVSDGQGLEDAADRLPGGRLEKQMKMVGHQAVAEERERIPCLGAGEIAKEHIPFALGARATASKIPVILAVLDGNLVCSYHVCYWNIFNNHPNCGCKSLEYSQNFRSITVSGLPYLMKNPHFDAVALPSGPRTSARLFPRLIAW